MAGLAFGGQLPLHHVLGGDAGVVGARHPEGVKAVHPFVADQDVLQGVVEGMAHVQHPGDVGGRNDDAEGGPLGVQGGGGFVLGGPDLQPLLFDILEFVALGQFGFAAWFGGFGGHPI